MQEHTNNLPVNKLVPLSGLSYCGNLPNYNKPNRNTLHFNAFLFLNFPLTGCLSPAPYSNQEVLKAVCGRQAI